MSIETIHQLSEKRKKWVETTRENDFEDGIKRFLTDLYPDNAHFIYELLQNAEDAKASEVQFVLNTDNIEFKHNGSQLFSISDVESITSIGNSPKKDDPTSIGKFGVGFKAVFAYTSTPEIKSGEYHFRIRDLVVPDTEGLVPRTLDENRTHFLFPFDNPQKSPEKACAEIEKNLRQLGEGTLLFLKNIRKIEYRLPDAKLGSLERIERSRDRIEISVQRPENLAPDSVHYLRFEKVVDVNDEDEGDLKSCRIAVAFGMERGKEQKWKIKPLDKGQVCIYFPAEKEASNLRFHLHAPFASTVARDSIRDCPANDELRDHIADLVTESMFAIRDQGLLDVAFLATLPNNRDPLDDFYKPIQEKLVEVFKNKKLTPMKRGGHAAASGIYRGGARLSSLISDKDLAIILGKNHSLPLWAANAPQRNQEVDNFLSSLGISEWDEKDLVSELSNQPDLVLRWLKKKSYKWHQEFYALLGDFLSNTHRSYTYQYRDRKYELSNLSIVRLSDGVTYKKGRDCHFPSDDAEYDKKLSCVDKHVYSSGKNKNQQKKAREFLGEIGVNEIGEKERIDLLLETFYQDNRSVELTDEQHLKHISDFIKWWKEGNYTIKFKSYAIFRVEGKDDFHKPIECFLDLPFEDTGLEALFGCSEIPLKNQKNPVSKKYEKVDGFIDFAKSLSVMQALEIREHRATKMQKDTFKKMGKKTHTTIDRDYFLNALIGHGTYWHNEGSPYYIGELDLKIHKIELSLAVWKTLCRVEEEKLSAFYLPNDANRDKQRRESSFLVNQLKSCRWIPDKDGRFWLPSDVTKESLHEDFPYNNHNGWLDAIGFGENAKKQSADHIALTRNAREMGFDNVYDAKKWAEIAKTGISPDEFLSKLMSSPEFPTSPVSNLERRQARITEQHHDAPEKKYELKQRSVRTTEIDRRTYLKNQYINDDDQMICQICQKEMPFKKRDGEYYFETKEALSRDYFTKEHEAQYLALCPECAARYTEFVKNDEDAIKKVYNALKNPDEPEILLRLGELTKSLRFVETHRQDIRTILQNE
ncbi:MAG: hypothetical protein F4X17_22390 [Gemmatimonadetes bacterium]|nr:hypothetical protein [Gemmatimonadota bacterium]